MTDIDTTQVETKDPEPTYEEELARKNRKAMAAAMWFAGWTYEEIADRLGYTSPSIAREAIERAVAATADDDDKAKLRKKIGLRLDRLLRSVWTKALNPAHEEHIAAARTALAIIDRHAKLFGVDAPSEVTVYTPAAQEIETWVATQTEQIISALPEEADVIAIEEAQRA